VTPREAAESWIGRQCFPVPVPYRKKAPTLKRWNGLRIGSADVSKYFAEAPQNIGVLLGEPYGLADVDLDCSEAIAAAAELAPPTGMVFGRASKPASHRFYRADPPVRMKKYVDPGNKSCLVELRGQKADGSIGSQTVVPPSVHETGEEIRFEPGFDREPANIEADELAGAVARIAAAALLARHWPKEPGGRHDAFLALAGLLCRGGWRLDDVVAFHFAIYRVLWGGGADRTRCAAEVRSSFEKAVAGGQVTGFPKLATAVGDVVAKTAAQWLGLKADRTPLPTAHTCAEGAVLPTIIVGGRDLREESAECVAVLQAANYPPHYFVQSGRMFEVVLNEKGRQIGREVTEAGLRGGLTRTADFRKKTAKGDLVPCFPPKDVVEDVLALAPGEWGFPQLDGIVSSPVIRTDGSILAEPGYDPQSRLFYSPEPGFRLPAIDAHPSSDHVDVARGLLDQMLEDFPWADESSRANAIAVVLTPVLRPVITGPTPMAAITARAAGSGKSLLAELVSLIGTGEPAEMCSLPRDEEEMRKALTTHLASMAQIVVFDNVCRRLDSGDLCKVLTETTHSDRAFRTHQKMVLPVRCTWIVTGNNLRLGGDMPRRVFWVRFDAKTSRPELRNDFQISDLKAWVSKRRPELLAALLTLARAWYSAGKPAPQMIRPLGSFESWSITIGGILEHAGIVGFLRNADEARDESDAEAGEWERFLQLLEEQFGGQPFSVADLNKKLGERVFPSFGGAPELSEAAEQLRQALPGYLAEVADRGGFFQRRAGKLFAEHCGRRFGEKQVHLRRDGISHHAQLWTVGSGSQ